jgi:hypothetical protein
MKQMFVYLFFVLFASSANAMPVFVDSWYVGEGPVWTSNPDVLNAQETAALLFGGNPLDYVISTISDQVSDINNMAFVDGWGDDQFLLTPVAQNFSLDTGAPGYDDPTDVDFSSYSAYVLDHSCFNRYSNPGEGCLDTQIGRNYAFRVAAQVPEPATIVLLMIGLVGAGFLRHRQLYNQALGYSEH